MNETNCPFCSSPESRVAIRENGFEGQKCSDCGLIYVSPRPSLAEIQDLYGHNEARVAAESHIASEFPKRLYARHHLKLIRRHVKKGRLLEIGAGAGYFLDEAQKKGFDCHGLEFNPIQAEFIKTRFAIDCEQTSLKQSSYMHEQFDLVYHCDVVSHFYDPIEEFNLTGQILKEDGYLVFETGNIGDIEDKYFECFESFQYPDHLFFYSTENVKYLLDTSGFELVCLHRFSLMPQFRFRRLMSTIKHLAGKKYTGNKALVNAVETEQQVPARSRTTRLRVNLMEYVHFLLRYKVGRWFTEAGQPQTLIVVARKCSNRPSHSDGSIRNNP